MSDADRSQLTEQEIAILERVLETSLWHERVHQQIDSDMVDKYVDRYTGLFNYPPSPPLRKGTPQDLKGNFQSFIDNEIQRIALCYDNKHNRFHKILKEEINKDLKNPDTFETITYGATYYFLIHSQGFKANVLNRLENEVVC